MGENNILTNLPVDVLELIMKRLSLNDLLRLRVVCRSCRKTISNAIEKKHCCHLREMPQVFLQFKNSRFFFSLIKNSVDQHLVNSQLKLTTNCIGTVEGWLIMADCSKKSFVNCFFLNPVTDVRIVIPSKLSLPIYPSVRGDKIARVRKMVASSKPNCVGSSDCYLVGLFNSYSHIAIYKLFDKSWTIVESDKDLGFYFMDVEIIGKKLYVSDTISQSMLIYCLKDCTNGPPKAKVLAKFPTYIRSNHHLSLLGKDEALRELYLITMFYDVEPEPKPEYEIQHGEHLLKIISEFVEPPQITNFEVFKLDTNRDPIGWQNVQLEDKVAFVSDFKMMMVMSRDELHLNKELITGNSIYFAFNFACPTNPWSGLQLGMFCLTDSSIKYFPVDKSKTGGDVPYQFPIWFVPSLC